MLGFWWERGLSSLSHERRARWAGFEIVAVCGQSSAVSSSDKAGHGNDCGNLGTDVPVGTLNSVLKQAGLKK